MPQPGSLSSILPPDDDWVAKRLADLQRQIDELKTAVPYGMASRNFDGTLDPPAIGSKGWGLTSAGVAVIMGLLLGGDSTLGGDVDIEGNLTVDGPTTLNGALTLNALLEAVGGSVQSGDFAAGSAGWRLRPNGNAEFNDLTLRGGIIGDDALENPISASTFTGDAELSLTFGTSYATHITKNLTVPAGFTQAIMFATTVATGISGGTTNAAISALTRINGVDGPEVDSFMVGGAIAAAPYSVKLTGLSGGDTIPVLARAKDGLSPGTLLPGESGCSLNGFAIFLR